MAPNLLLKGFAPHLKRFSMQSSQGTVCLPVTLTPATYAAVLTELLMEMDAGSAYNMAYSRALAEVTVQVETNADALYAGYIDSNADAIYLGYIQSQADTLYSQVAAQAILEQLGR